jgi:hypothetical protein
MHAEPPKGASRVTNKDAPEDILKLPARADAGDLEDEGAVVVEEVVHLLEEGRVLADADVFGHLERDNLGEGLAGGDVAVVAAEDAALVLGNAVLAHAVRAKLGLVLREGD